MSMRNPFREDVDGQSRKISKYYNTYMDIGSSDGSIYQLPGFRGKFFKCLRYPMMRYCKNSGGPCSCCVQLIPWVYLVKTTT